MPPRTRSRRTPRLLDSARLEDNQAQLQRICAAIGQNSGAYSVCLRVFDARGEWLNQAAAWGPNSVPLTRSRAFLEALPTSAEPTADGPRRRASWVAPSLGVIPIYFPPDGPNAALLGCVEVTIAHPAADLLKLLQNWATQVGLLLAYAELRAQNQRHAARQRELEARFNLLLDTSPNATLIHQGSKLVYANRALAELTGRSEAELYHLNFWELAPAKERLAWQRIGRAYLTHDDLPRQLELALERVDGAIVWTAAQISRAHIEGQPAVDIAMLDVTARVQVEAALQERNAQLDLLRQMSLELTSADSRPQLYDTIVTQMRRLLNCDYSALYLLHPERDALTLVQSSGPELLPLGTFVARGEGLSGKVWATRRPQQVSDNAAELTLPAGQTVFATVGAPLIWQAEFLGVVTAASPRQPEFSPVEIDLLTLFASQAAAVLHNLEERERLAQEHHRLAAMARLAARLNTTVTQAEVTAVICEEAALALTSSVATVRLVDADSGRLHHAAGYGPGAPPAEIELAFTQPQDLALLTTLADQMGVMVENAQLRVQAEQEAVAAERRRLGRDLHDSVTQALYSVMMLTGTARNLAEAGNFTKVASILGKIEANNQQALREMRLLIYELRPQVLEEEGLVGALQSRLETVEKRAGIAAELHVTGNISLPPAVEAELYRLAQEALNNALKHAAAKQISVRLSQEAAQFALEVCDDGGGFDPQAANGGGQGLTNLRERAALLGADLDIQSSLGAGTCVRVRWQAPVPPAALAKNT
jgi:PAS domain S-box-containing protein